MIYVFYNNDPLADDQGEYDPNTRTVRIRLGNGASGTMGGTINPNDPPIVCTYQVQVNPNAAGEVPTQATTQAKPGNDPTVPAISFPSGDGMYPNRPTVIVVQTPADLSIKVRTDPDPPVPNMPVTHVILVHNGGPGTAPPGTVVTYEIPPGGKIRNVTGGNGWNCMMDAAKVTCTYNNNIPPGDTPEIRIVVDPPTNPGGGGGGTGEDPFTTKVTVTSPGVSDPDPSNNTIDYVTQYGASIIAGGGFSCALVRAHTPAPAAALGAAALLLGVALLRRTRRRNGSL